MRKAAAMIALGVVAGVAAGCGGSDPAPRQSSRVATGDFEPDVAAKSTVSHIHGVGANLADDSLFVATHTGLFRVVPNGGGFARVGGSARDTMGFAVLGPDEFLASGHPSPSEEGPALIGLIRSTDAGRSWHGQALAGDGDLHVIRPGREAFYAHDASGNRLFEGIRGGSGLLLRATPPGTTVDLAIDPRSDRRLYATTDRGLFRSTDRARTWRLTDARRTGLIAFVGDRLTLIDGGGLVSALSRADGDWKRLGQLPGTLAALSAVGNGGLVAATQEGGVYSSQDGGRRWSAEAFSASG